MRMPAAPSSKDHAALAADLMLKITRLPKPVIAEVDGLATAAGCQLVSSCDLAICTDTSTFCTPGVNIGLFCSTPMVALTRAAHRKQAMEMLLTGETIDASTAKDFGIVNRIVPKQYLTQVVNKYAAVIAGKSASTLKIGKEAFYRQIDMPLEDAYAYTIETMVENMLARSAENGIGAFLDKASPRLERRLKPQPSLSDEGAGGNDGAGGDPDRARLFLEDEDRDQQGKQDRGFAQRSDGGDRRPGHRVERDAIGGQRSGSTPNQPRFHSCRT